MTANFNFWVEKYINSFTLRALKACKLLSGTRDEMCRVYQTASTNFKREFPHSQTRKKVHTNKYRQTQFSRESPTICWPQFFRFQSVGTCKDPRIFSCNWKRTDTSPTQSWRLSNCRGPLKACDSPRCYVSRRTLNQVEKVLSICCELWLDKQYELNSY